MTDKINPPGKLPYRGDWYTYWLTDGFIDIRLGKIISYTGIEQKMGTKYIYTLMRYDIDYYEMYKDSMYFDDLIDPKFTRNESEIFETFNDAVLATLELMCHHSSRMVNILTRKE